MRRHLAILVACAATLPAAPALAANGGTSAPTSAVVADGGVSPKLPPPPVTTTTTTTTTTRRPGRGSASGLGRADVPPAYRRLYVLAGRAHGVDWRLLAAMGKIESDHGRSSAPGVQSGLNYAKCCAGPMQICIVATCGDPWSHYGVDANGDGTASVYDPADAIYAAGALVADLETVVGQHPKLLLAAYNAGAGRVLRYRGVPPYPETRSYVARGLRYMASLRH